jgi:hypothetical protein
MDVGSTEKPTITGKGYEKISGKIRQKILGVKGDLPHQLIT